MALQAIKQTAIVVGGANAVGFLITALLKTHKITDLIGTGSFVLASLQLTKNNWKTIFHNPAIPWFQNRLFWINAGVILWGSRLGAYLFSRILYTHEDKRLAKFFPEKDEGLFDKTKSNFPINLGGFWSIQALWGIICLLPVSMINSIPNSNTAVANALSSLNIKAVADVFVKNLGSGASKLLSLPVGWLPIAGIFTGIAIESIADYQKTKYRSNKSNDNHWCNVGLWSLSRYPNCKIFLYNPSKIPLILDNRFWRNVNMVVDLRCFLT